MRRSWVWFSRTLSKDSAEDFFGGENGSVVNVVGFLIPCLRERVCEGSGGTLFGMFSLLVRAIRRRR